MNAPQNVDLTRARDPKQGQATIQVVRYMSAGVLYMVHWDQNEKLWKYGFFIYGGADGASGQLLSMTLLRNKTPESL